jgi:(S)-mandelate dehydrogenase
MRLSKAQNIADLREAARARLPKIVFDYIDGAAEDEKGKAHNRAAFERIRMVPRYLVDISQRRLNKALFGQDYALPFGIAPTGLTNLAWPRADLDLARAARDANIPYVLSTAGTTSIETIAEAAPDHFWYQLYVPRSDHAFEDLIRRAEAAGAKVLMVTVDVPLSAKRERDIRNGFMLPLRITPAMVIDGMLHPAWSMKLLRYGMPRFENLAPYADPKAGARTLAGYIAGQISRSVTWEVIDKVRKLWQRPLMIKGIQSLADAQRAAEHGVDGIVISNHGGRQLDSAPAPIEILPALRDAVGDKLVLTLDSGIRRGADIAKALALGAVYVFIGRATIYRVAAGGRAGVDKALSFLQDELDRCLGQIGCPDVNGLPEIETFVDGSLPAAIASNVS